jgi:hypothetical protein
VTRHVSYPYNKIYFWYVSLCISIFIINNKNGQTAAA